MSWLTKFMGFGEPYREITAERYRTIQQNTSVKRRPSFTLPLTFRWTTGTAFKIYQSVKVVLGKRWKLYNRKDIRLRHMGRIQIKFWVHCQNVYSVKNYLHCQNLYSVKKYLHCQNSYSVKNYLHCQNLYSVNNYLHCQNVYSVKN